MHSPVRHQPAGIIPEPAEIKMKTVFVEGLLGSRSEPHVVVYASWYGTIWFHWDGFHPSLIGPTFYQTNLAQFSGLDIIYGVGILGAASLPLAHLYYFPIAFCGFHHDITFLNGIGQWLFHINVFPR